MVMPRRIAYLMIFAMAVIVGSSFLALRISTRAFTAISPAEIRVNAPGGAQTIGVPFDVTTELTRFTTGGGITTWGGYAVQVTYDASKVQVNNVASGGTCSASGWALGQMAPTVQAGCAFQNSTSIGLLDRITLECIAAGTFQLHLVTLVESPLQGTTLFDNGGTNIATDLLDSGTVTCGVLTPTITITLTPTLTRTATATPTQTLTPTATSIVTVPTAICTTNVGGPPTLGLDVDCDTDPLFGGVLGDGCADSEDADPSDPWGQIYTVPAPALLFNPSGLRDNIVSPQDAQAVFGYYRAGASIGTGVYEQDLNQNGVKDGWEYDRRPLGPGLLGAPDGSIAPQDAQMAFNQYRLGVQCSSGYNMAKPSCTTNVGGPPTLGIGRDCDLDFAFPGVLGDGCVDSEDANPNDPWGQIYTVPAPALLFNPSGLRDNVVAPQDAQAVLAYFVAGASTGSAAYEQDLNQNGVKDGWEYDRRPLGGGAIGAPDGAVTAQDAQAAFKQFMMSVDCTSGYNMQN